MSKKTRNTIILSVLFFGPLIFYLFLLTGTNNFAKLPVLTENVNDVVDFKTVNDETVSLDKKISILCFLGETPLNHKTNALNLNEKIYKHFYRNESRYDGFQIVVLLPKGSEDNANQLKKELGATYNIDQWHFLFASESELRNYFGTLRTGGELDESLYTPLAFIIDRDMNLRGRNDDMDMPDGLRYGYDAESISTVHQEMVDDVKVVVAQDRLALKKNKREI